MAKVCLIDNGNRLIGFEVTDDFDEDDVVVPNDSDLETDGSYIYHKNKDCFIRDRATGISGNWITRKGDRTSAPHVTVQDVAQARADRQLRRMQRRKLRREQRRQNRGLQQ